jgi:hypothetical protein
MPAAFEQVLNKPLSGEEVRRIIMVKIGEMLTMDSRLAGHMAFPAFAAKVTIAIQLEGAVHPNVDREIDIKHNNPGSDPNVPAEYVVLSTEQTAMPPNEARVDAGLGVPVLTHDERGREVEREVKYAKPVKRKGGTA